jgi:tRNA(adenine34) deaminase
MTMNHDHYMGLALRAGEEAMARGDWPTGSVVVLDGRVVGSGQNRQVSRNDITEHAETNALKDCFNKLHKTDLAGATVYTSMEPCPMCAEAMRMARVTRLVLGLRHADLKRTDLGTYSIEAYCGMLAWPLEIVTGVRHADCLGLRKRWGKDRVANGVSK